jgi:LPXTG-site transpeptidase (sortase) family protein
MSSFFQNKKLLVKMIVLFAVLVFCVVLFQALFYSLSDEIPLPPNSQRVTESDTTPVRISIPKIGVDTQIEQVGITKKGNIATPSNFSEVGWYKYGSLPGETGSAVLAGHVDNGLGLPAVFSRLNELKNGDEIIIFTEKGNQLRFWVLDKKEYDYNATVEKIFTDKSGKFINLITCTGRWLESQKTHDKRLVVNAVLIEND